MLFLITSRQDSENNGFLAGVPLLPPPSRAVSRLNSLPLPFRTPVTQPRPNCSQHSQQVTIYKIGAIIELNITSFYGNVHSKLSLVSMLKDHVTLLNLLNLHGFCYPLIFFGVYGRTIVKIGDTTNILY